MGDSGVAAGADTQVMGLPRYLAAASLEDPERTVWLAEELMGAPGGLVSLVHCGGTAPAAADVAREIQKRGRHVAQVIVAERSVARSAQTVDRLAQASAIWVFADDLIDAFLTTFATPMAFATRSRALQGLPVVGVGGGAVALGGLLTAQRVCGETRYDLVTGLGWAPRALVDASVTPHPGDPFVTHASVRSLPGLLGLNLGAAGAVRVEGGHIESVGSEPVLILGLDTADQSLVSLPLPPGKTATIAPPPFAPFERGLLPRATVKALATLEHARRGRDAALSAPLRQAPPPPDDHPGTMPAPGEVRSGVERFCPLCNQMHGGAQREQLTAA